MAISAVIGDNGVLTQSQQTSTKTVQARFLEDAGMAYSEIYAEEVVKPGFTGVTEAQVVTKLTSKYGYTIEPSITGSITAIAPAKASTELGVEDTDTIQITPDNADGNYVKLNGAYYKINLSSSNVTLGEAQNSIGGSGNTFAISDATSSNTSVATVEKGTNTVTITGVGNGTSTITVKYTDSITTTITVTVKGKYTITVAAADNNGTVSGGGTFVEGTSAQISATAETGYTFKEWNDGNKDNPRTIIVSSTTAGTYTATFEEESIQSYVGYYINKGTDQNPQYAIIYVDLVGQTVYTGGALQKDDNSLSVTVSSSATSGKTFKSYVVTDKKYTDINGYFGTNYVIEVAENNTGTDDRFLAMALSDYDTNKYAWWYSRGNIFSNLGTLYDIGNGKMNTELVKALWDTNPNEQNTSESYSDIWSLITLDTNNKVDWFIPSHDEWKAFGAMSWTDNADVPTDRNITKGTSGNYYNCYGLEDRYWTSSRLNGYPYQALFADFSTGNISYQGNTCSPHVRLSTSY